MSLFERRRGDRSSSPSSMHLRAALVDALVVGSCFPGPQAAERGRTGMLSLVAGRLLQAHGILDAYGGAIGDAEWVCQAREGEACLCCMDFRHLFACQRDARGRSDLHVLSCRRRLILQVICANLRARVSNLPS